MHPPDSHVGRPGGPPRITVIVAVLNGASTLRRCVDSIRAQTYPDVELVVVDGGSTDGSVEILESYGPAVSWFRQKGTGIFDAWNQALDHATGEWMCFLGADDRFWNPRVLSDMAPHLSRADADGIRVVYGKVAAVSGNGEVRRLMGRPWERVRERLRWEMCIPHPGLFHHRSLFERHGRFDDSYRIAGDYDFLMRELRDGEARFVPEVVTTAFQEGGMSNRPEFTRTALHEMARVRRRYDLRAPLTKRISATYLKIHLSILLSRTLGHGGARHAKGLYRRVRALIG
jgi:glycosyltransferase involved in cell wall biosynthesis